MWLTNNRKGAKPPFKRKPFFQMTLRSGKLKEWNIFEEFLGQFLRDPVTTHLRQQIALSYFGHQTDT